MRNVGLTNNHDEFLYQDLVRLRTYGHVAILVAVELIAIVYAFPGYMNYDAAEQLLQARAHWVTDYHPPFIAAYWRFFEIFVEGPISLLLLQLTLFIWGAYAILRLRLSNYVAAWITAAIVMFPPVFTTMAVVWKDSQMAGFLLAGIALSLRANRIGRVVGFSLFVAAAAVRWNGGAALPPLVFLAVTMAWPTRRWRTIAITGVLLGVAFFASSGLNRAFTDQREYNWYRTTAMFDIVGVGCYGSLASDEDFVKILDGVGLKETHDLKKRFCELYPPGQRNWYEYAVLFSWPPTAKERLARKRAWKEMVTGNPGGWFESRLLLARDHLGLWGGLTLWQPVSQEMTGTEEQRVALHIDRSLSSFQRWSGQKFVWLADKTPLYRPWIYLVLSLLLFGWAIWRKDLLVGCIVGSGLSYQTSIFVLANAPDFRFSHWMITCALIGLALRYAKPARSGAISDSVPTA